MVKIEEAKR